MKVPKATSIVNARILYDQNNFSDLVIWRLPNPARASHHPFKYRLAYVVQNRCVVRYDNEVGKGDHRHYESAETPYHFHTLSQLLMDFQNDIARWNRENSYP
ncbi:MULTISPECIES: DUF6516 family protein [unclassified Duganella]|uniref:toxin-antitoxin system TumE family protein n=1 Tax=unclassified Duganella TaxID=2636909 RepID=UPI000E345617|nr:MULTISPECIES: DUF6516 family protein [unclassified Duganella]RFP14583.1 hypothetical protein D0T23_11270 [Duganella sp. BJB475]RFP30931.1 hypothetical protein D0T21_13650 [Duganella sp. BJB476]